MIFAVRAYQVMVNVKNNKNIKPQKNKNNFNKSSKLRKNELKSKIYINYTDKNSKILYTNSNNVKVSSDISKIGRAHV